MILSIITINYNNAPGLENTIKSVINQNLTDFEYLVIDGGSQDTSLDIIKKYSDKITHSISEPDTGIYNAMNKGIKLAKGTYVVFINSGDTICIDADLKQIASHATGEDIVYFDLEVSNADGSYKFIKNYPTNLDFYYFMVESLSHPGAFIKREKLIEYGLYNENFNVVSDWAFFLDAIVKDKCTFKHVSTHYTTFYTDGISSLSENKEKIENEKDQHIKASFPEYYSFYKNWLDNKAELHKLKYSRSVKYLKKLGLLKWLTIK